MSRIGKLPVVIPDSVKLDIDGRKFKATGPKGELELRLPAGVKVEHADNTLVVTLHKEAEPALWGLSRSLLANLVQGVNEGYEKKLEIHGVGYKAQAEGNKLTLNLGFSHPINYKLADGITATVEGNIITIAGINKQLVGQVTAEIRDFRRPEPYKGKGIRYQGEQVRRKAGKTAGKAES